MKLVAVTQRVDVHCERTERRDALDQRLIRWLMAAGYAPVPVPNTFHLPLSTKEAGVFKLDGWLKAIRPDALILSGGNDLKECVDRDETEAQLLGWAKRHAAPVLGICRGMQMMGVWSGGSLKSVDGHVRTRHVLHGTLSGEVNSFHCYSLADCPQEFNVLAQASDGEIEAIRHSSLPWEGWMWHPEREEDFQQMELQRLKRLFSE